MSYSKIDARLKRGEIVILDGGTGTELERRGVSMDPEAWCGPATLENADILEGIHRDYIEAGADVITANTYASSRIMLASAGYGDRFEEINKKAIETAMKARDKSGKPGVLVAGSLSCMVPMASGTAHTDPDREPSMAEKEEAFGELAQLLKAEGCDLIIQEMVYHPLRMEPNFKVAMATGLPVWTGFSARRGEDGRILSFAHFEEIPFEETVGILKDFEVQAAGVMHTPANITGEGLAIIREVFDGPLMAYPDSGYFKMPQWQFDNVIPPETFLAYAKEWAHQGAQIIGGCCGLSPEHIAALKPLKDLVIA